MGVAPDERELRRNRRDLPVIPGRRSVLLGYEPASLSLRFLVRSMNCASKKRVANTLLSNNFETQV